MSRVIKFRAWDGEKMTKDFLVYSDGEVLEDKGNTDDGGIAHVKRSWPIMQFTGLTDKNGKEIYEGDVLRGGEGEGEIHAKVAFEDGAFVGLYIDALGHGTEIKHFLSVGYTVIGNIYENPQLITA